MKYNLVQHLKDHRYAPIMNGDKPITLGGALEQACINGSPEKPDGETKLRQFKLAQRIGLCNSIDLTSEDVTLLKTLSSSIFSAIAYGSIVEALENPTEEWPND